MILYWKNSTLYIGLIHVPYGLQYCAQQINKLFRKNAEKPIVKKAFELSKLNEGDKIDFAIQIENQVMAILPSAGYPRLLTYDYGFLLCLEYLSFPKNHRAILQA